MPSTPFRRSRRSSIRPQLEQIEERTLLSSSCSILGAIDETGEKDIYTFVLADRSRLYFDSLTDNGQINWTLVGPRGTEVSNRSFQASDSTDVPGNPVLDLPAGSYSLTVDGVADTTNVSYEFRLCDLASATPIVPGTPFSGQLNPGNETDLYRFNVAAGDRYSFDAQAVSSSNGRVRLIDPYDNVVMETGLNTDVATFTLPQPGTYVVAVEGRRNQTTPVDYTYNFMFEGNTPPAPLTGTALALDTVVNDSISIGGEQDNFVFTLANDARLYFDSRTNSSNFQWSLIGPPGTVVNNRAFTGSDLQSVLSLPAGTYQLRVSGSTASVTGAYSFALQNLASAAPITPGNAVTGTLNPASENDLYRFNAVAGDRFFFDTSSSSTQSARWRLFDPFDNELLGNAFLSNDVETQTLSQPGVYTLMIEGVRQDTGTISYTVNVVPVSNDAAVLPLDTVVTSTINEPGEQDRYTFTLGSTSRLYFDSQTNDGAFVWTLVGPRGTEVSNRAFTGSDLQPILDVPAGDYTLTIDGTGDKTGTYQFQLQNLASAAPITPGNAVIGTLNPASENDLYRFNAVAGDRFFFNTSSSSTQSARWRLFDPFDNELLANAFLSNDVETRTLSQPGVYTLMIEGVRQDTGTISYTVNVVPVSDDAAVLSLDTVTTSTINEPGEQDHYTFTLGSASRLYFDSQTNDGAFVWTLVGPRGTEVSNRAFTGSDLQPILSLPAGDYTLIIDGTGDKTGTYEFQLQNLASAAPITPGNAVTGTLNPASENDLYRFTAVAGDRFFFDTSSSSTQSARWRLFDPFDNELLANAFLSSDVETRTLSQPGVYTLMIEGVRQDTGTISYTVNVVPVSDDSTVLLLDSVVTSTINEPGEQDHYTFTLGSISRLYFDSQTNDGAFVWTLVGPRGTEVSNRAFTGSDLQPILNLPAGDYTLTVDGTGDKTGTYQFQLQNLASAAPRTPGTAVMGTLNPASENDLYRFTAVAGDRFYFDTSSSSTQSARWRLFDPFDNELLANAFLSSDVETRTLSQPGVYTLMIEGVRQDTGTINYTVNVVPVSDDTAALTLDTVVTNTINEPGEQDHYTFTLGSTSRLYFDSQTNDGAFAWTLVGPRGTDVSNRTFTASDLQPILNLPAGNYTLTVDGTGDKTGTYQFQLQNLASAAPITPGTPVVGTLNPAAENDLYRFDVNAGDTFLFDSSSGSTQNARWRLFDPFDVDRFGGSQFLSSDVGPITLNQPGSYTLLIEGRVIDSGTTNYTFNVLFQGNTPPTPLAGTALTLGSTVSSTIGAPGEQDDYVFTLPTATRLYFDSLTDNGNINWNLIGPRGSEVTNRSFQVSDSTDITNPVLEVPAGSYQLKVFGSGSSTGSYSFRLSNFDVAGAANVITPGNAFSGQLSPGNETDFFSFTAVAGQMLFFDVQSASSANGRTRLFDPFSNVVMDTSLTTDVDTFTLSPPGTYVVAVEGRRNQTAPVDYSYNLQPLAAPIPSALALGATVNGTISLAGESDVYTFSLASASRLYFDALTNADFRWTLTGPLGTPVSNRSFQSSDSTDAVTGNPVVDVPTGSYTLTIDAPGDSTGNYMFRLVNIDTAAAANPINPGTSFSGQLNPGNETDFFSFNVAAGQMFFFDTLTVASGNGRVRLFDPFSNVVMDTALSTDVDTFSLSQPGTYVLAVEGRRIQTTPLDYTYNMQPVSAAIATTLTLGATVNGTITPTGESDVYTFDLATASRLYFDALTDATFTWTLTGPSGTIVTNRSFQSSDSTDAVTGNPVVNVPAGSYTLTIDAPGDTTGNYTFRLVNVDTAALANPITPGTSFNGQLNPGNETDFFSFNVVAGQMFYFDAQAVAGANGRVRLFDPFSNVVMDTGLSTDVDTFRLSQPGTYVLAVEGRRNQTTPLDYTYNMQPVPAAVPTALTLGATVNGTITPTGESDVYTFTLATASRLYFDALTDATFTWTLTGPSGTIVNNRSFQSSDSTDAVTGNPVVNVPAGSYTLTIDAPADTTGNYTFRLVNLDTAALANPITPGTPFNGQLNPGNETDFFSFNVIADQMFFFDAQSVANGNGRARLFDPFSNVVMETALVTDVDTFALSQPGTYVLAVEGRRNQTTPIDYGYNIQPVINGGPDSLIRVAVNPEAGLLTSESGGTATFSVSLCYRPTADVRIDLHSSNTAEGVASPAFLIFTPDNFSVPQIVTVTGQDDPDQDGNIAYSIILDPTTSADSRFDDVEVPDVAVTNQDNDSLNNAPNVDDQTFAVDERSPNGTVVGTVLATDPDVGQNLSYVITAGNTSGAFAIDSNSGQITVADGALLDFETTPTFSLTVQVTDDGLQPLSDTATITINLNNVVEADLAVINPVASPDPVNPGGNVTYQVTIVNQGPETASSVSSTFPVPANTTFVSFTAPSGVNCNTPALGGTGTVTCTAAQLNVNDPQAFTLVVTVDLNTQPATVITNSTSVTSSTLDPDTTNNSATQSVTVAGCSLVVTNTNDSGAGSLREAINCANSDVDLDTISFAIPGTGPHTISPTSGLPDIINPVVIDGYTQGASTADPADDAKPNTLAVGNNAVLRIELNGSSAGASNGLTVVAGGSTIRGLAINRFNDDGIQLGLGQAGSDGNRIEGNFIGTDITGTIARGNGAAGVNVLSSNNTIGGTAPASRNVISANVSEGVKIGGLASTVSGNFVQGNYVGTNAAGTTELGNGEAGIEITGSNNRIVGNTIAFNGSGSGISIIQFGQIVPIGNAILTNSMFLNDGIGIDLNNDGRTANDTTDSDSGPNNLQNFPVIDSATLSAGLLTVTYRVPSATTNSAYPITVEFFKADADAQEGQSFVRSETFTAADFAAGTKTVTFAPAIPIALGDQLVATATDNVNNTSEFSEVVAVGAVGADLEIQKSADSNSVTVGENVTYTIEVTNNGPQVATNVIVTDPLPPDTAFVSATPSSGTCTFASDVVTCELGTLAVSGQSSINLIVQTLAVGSLDNQVTVDGDQTDPVGGNDEDLVTISVVDQGGGGADLEIEKSADSNSVTVGENVTYTIEVTNHGPQVATNVIVTDPLPANTSFVSATSSSGTCTSPAT